MKSVSPKPLTLKIVAIEILETNLNHPQVPIMEENVFQFDISLEQRINLRESIIIVICTINILNNVRDVQLAHTKSSCVFEVKNLESYSDKKSDELNLPEDFRVNLNSISISTARGILFSFLRGTYLHNAILPIVNPQSFKVDKPE